MQYSPKVVILLPTLALPTSGSWVEVFTSSQPVTQAPRTQIILHITNFVKLYLEN